MRADLESAVNGTSLSSYWHRAVGTAPNGQSTANKAVAFVVGTGLIVLVAPRAGRVWREQVEPRAQRLRSRFTKAATTEPPESADHGVPAEDLGHGDRSARGE